MHWRNVRWAVVLPLGLGTTVSLMGASTVAECPYSEAVEWVATHQANLPRTLTDLNRYDMKYRKVILARLPAADRVAVWREHFAVVLAEGNTLTAEQRAFIQEVSANLPTYANGAEGKERMTSDSIPSRIRALFADTVARRVFFSLGETTPALGSSLDALLAKATAGVFGKKLPAPDCSCASDASNCPPLPYFCYEGLSNGSCREVSGCGPLWLWYCDGQCELIV